MLNEVELHNFQIHRKLRVKLVPGVNVIVGETNMGKSSIIRALAWLINGRPLGAAKIWQTLGTVKPMSVSVTDVHGNKIGRTPRTYTINQRTPLKAFGTAVPDDVVQLLPLQPINWSRQLDPPFMINSTGGSAAKVIGRAAGADDQEQVMVEIKNRLAASRSEVKRQKTNQAEAQATVSRLQSIPKLKFQATKLKFRLAITDRKRNQASSLSMILIDLQEIDRVLSEDDPTPHLHALQGIERLIQNQKQVEAWHQDLQAIISRLENIGDTDTTFLTEALEMIQTITDARAVVMKAREQGGEITKVMSRLLRLDQEIPQAEIAHSQAQREFDTALQEAGVCPFCMQEIGGQHAAC